MNSNEENSVKAGESTRVMMLAVHPGKSITYGPFSSSEHHSVYLSYSQIKSAKEEESHEHVPSYTGLRVASWGPRTHLLYLRDKGRVIGNCNKMPALHLEPMGPLPSGRHLLMWLQNPAVFSAVSLGISRFGMLVFLRGTRTDTTA